MTASINASTSSGVVVTSDTSGVLALQTAGTTAVTINSSQQVGIGTSSPSYTLDITANANASIAIGQSSDDPFVWLDRSDGGSNRLAWRLRESSTRQLVFETGTSATKYGQTFTQAMTLDNSGTLYVGTTTQSSSNTGLNIGSPSAGSTSTLISMQNRSTSNNSGVQISFRGLTSGGSESDYGYITMVANDTTAKNSYVGFWTTNSGTIAERARIDSSGNLLVGATSSPSSSVSGVRISNPINGAVLCSSGSTTTSVNQIAFVNGNGTVGTINTNGSATAYNTSSDYRLKENVQNMTGALAKVNQLRPVTYDWIADKSQGQGFIAHELQVVVPDCVTGEKDAVDAEGKPIYQAIDVSFLVATLTSAIQELNTLVTAQAAQITALNAKVGITS